MAEPETTPERALGAPETRPAALAALQDALSRSIDAQAAYDVMVDHAAPDCRPLAQKFRATHAEHAQRLGAMVTAYGGTPHTEAGLMATLNQALLSLRALFDEIGEDALDSVPEAEDRVIRSLDEAMTDVPEARDREELAQMRGELETLLAEAETPAA